MVAEQTVRLAALGLSIILVLSLASLVLGGGVKLLTAIMLVIQSIPNIIGGAWLQAIPAIFRSAG